MRNKNSQQSALSTVQDEIAEEAGDDDDPAPASVRRQRDVLLVLLLAQVEPRAGANPHHHRPAPTLLSLAPLLHWTAGLGSRAGDLKSQQKNKVACDECQTGLSQFC